MFSTMRKAKELRGQGGEWEFVKFEMPDNHLDENIVCSGGP